MRNIHVEEDAHVSRSPDTAAGLWFTPKPGFVAIAENLANRGYLEQTNPGKKPRQYQLTDKSYKAVKKEN